VTRKAISRALNITTGTVTAGGSAGYQRSYVYDGLPTSVQFTINGNVHTFTATYDGASRLKTVQYPSLLTLTYNYNPTLGGSPSRPPAIMSSPTKASISRPGGCCRSSPLARRQRREY
jgi:hypothetical protein